MINIGVVATGVIGLGLTKFPDWYLYFMYAIPALTGVLRILILAFIYKMDTPNFYALVGHKSAAYMAI